MMTEFKLSANTPGRMMAVPLLTFAFGMKPVHAQDWREALTLAGTWKFEIGDDPKYCERDYQDSKWGQIHVPGAWENQGFPGYDGYAWYRKNFHTPPQAEKYLRRVWHLLQTRSNASHAAFGGPMGVEAGR